MMSSCAKGHPDEPPPSYDEYLKETTPTLRADELPPEMVTHIMQYLSVSDRKDAALVCRRWYQASLDPKIQRNLVLSVKSSVTNPRPFTGLRNRLGFHLSITDIDGSSNSQELLKNCEAYLSAKLLTLSLRGASVQEHTLVNILQNCVSLTTLDLSCCNSLFHGVGGLVNKLQNIKLQNLRHMDLSSLKQLSDATLCAFLGIAPKLESLELASAPFLFSTSGYLGEAASSRPNSAALTFTRFIHEVDRLKGTFKSLNISRTSVSDLSLEGLCTIKGLNLKRLVLVSCKDLSDAGIVRLCAAQPGLVELNLASNAQLTGVSVKHVCTNLQLIKSLNLTKIRLHPNEFKPLIRLANCSQLILSACFQQQPAEADVEAAFRVWAPNMRSLDLSYCSGLSNKILVNMCQYLKGLTELDVSSCFRLDDVTVREISQKLNQLTQLRMGWCKHITDLGLLGFYHEDFTHDCTKECRCGRTRNEVYFEYTPPVRDIAPREIVPSQAQIESAKVKHGETGAYPISLLTNLSVLDLTMCTKLTDASISSVVKFARLKSLCLSMCSRITDRSLIAIASNNPLMEIIDVSQCRELTDQAIFALVAGCRRLTHINLSGCPKITDTSIENMVKRRVKLKFLDVSMCNISLESIEMLERLVPTLQTIHKLYTSVPDHVNSKMKSKCSKK